ncbi:MAG: M3 family metallopeptidase [Simkania negevensis]|nr:M3 family metallopeptidase [Simkania negevensis]
MDALPPPPPTYLEISISEKVSSNPLLTSAGPIRFDQISSKHFFAAVKDSITNLEKELKKLEAIQHPTWENLIIPLEKIEQKMHRVFGPISHLYGVMNSVELRKDYLEVQPLIDEFRLRIEQSRPLYMGYRKIEKSKQWQHASSAQKRALEWRLLSGKHAGIHLSEKKKERVKQLYSELSTLQSKFMANSIDAIKKYSFPINNPTLLEGIPAHIIKMIEKEKTSGEKEWHFTLSLPIYSPVMTHAKNRDLRKALYLAKIKLASEGDLNNQENLLSQLKMRKELAQLIGYDSFAELSLDGKMAKKPEAVFAFLEKLRDAAWEKGNREVEEVRAFAKEKGLSDPFMPWDFSYFAERLKEEKFSFSDQDLKPYFSLPVVLHGLFDLTHFLFGVKVEEISGKLPTWHPDVKSFVLKDQNKKEIAYFYLDPYLRPETKRSGAWMDESLKRVALEGELQLPIAYIICNLIPPLGKAPALLKFDEVTTLFHEFGHALQHMLTTVSIPSVSGTNGLEWDMVELPSQFMENWCYHKPTLKKISSHIETKEPLPDHLIEKMIAARIYLAATSMLKQLHLGLTDLTLHHLYDPESKQSPFTIFQKTGEITSPLPILPEDRSLCSFHHIFSQNAYAAGYYSYLWAKVLSTDVFSAFEEGDIKNQRKMQMTGERFKNTFLSLGGSEHPLKIFTAFRNRSPDITPLLRQYGLLKTEEK